MFSVTQTTKSRLTARLAALLLGVFSALSVQADPPTYNGGIGVINFNEDTAVSGNISGAFEDPDGPDNEIVFTIDSLDPTDIVVITQMGARGQTVFITGLADAFGPFTFNLVATDRDGEQVSVPLGGTVLPQPDQPQLDNPLGNLVIDEDEPLIPSINLDSHFSDVDGDILNYRINAQSDASVIEATVAGNVLSLTAIPNGAGDNDVEICANDGVLPTDVCDVLAITVNEINDPTTVTGGLSPLTVAEDESPIALISLVPAFEDVDDPISYSVTSLPAGVINATIVAGNQLQLSTIANVFGNTTVTVTAGDGRGPDTSTDMLVEVTPVNDAPVQDAVLNPVVVDEDEPVIADVDLNAFFSDIDGDSLSYLVSVTPSGVINASVAGSILSFSTIADANGSATVQLQITDGTALPLTASIPVTVQALDDAPIKTGSVGTLTVDEDQAGPLPSFDLSTIYSDVDTPNLTYTVSAVTPASVINASVTGSILNLALIPDANGTATVLIEVTDGTTAAPSESVTVEVNPTNDDPTQTTPFSPLTVLEDQASIPSLDLNTFFTDVDGDPLSFSFTITPAGVINASLAGSVMTFSTLPELFGTATIEVTVSDGGGGTDAVGLLAVDVQAQNDPPTKIGAVGTMTFDEDQVAPLATFDLDTIYDDIDSPTLTYTIVPSTPSGIFTPSIAGSILSFTLIPDANGTGTVLIAVSDGFAPGPSETVTVVVNSINDVPTVVSPLGTISALEDEGALAPIDLLPIFGDVDGDSLNYSLVSVTPAGLLTATLTGSTLQLNTNLNQNGTATVIVEAIDGGTVAVQDILTVNIGPQEDSPVLDAAIADQVVDEDGSIAFINLDSVFSDPDGDTLSYAVVSNTPTGIINADVNAGELRLLTIPNLFGIATVTIEATDPAGNTATDVVQVTVNSVNDAPVVINPAPATLEEDTAGTQTEDATAWFSDVDLPLDTHTYALVGVTGDPVFDSGSVGVSAAGIVSFTLAVNESGFGFIEVSLTDQGGITVTSTLQVIVNAVNDPPFVANPPGVYNALEDEGAPQFSLVGVFDDDDIGFTGDTLTYSVTSNPTTPLGTLSISGDNVVLSQLPHENGTISVEVTASDIDNETASVIFDIDIAPVNDAPFENSTTPGLIQINEDAPDTGYALAAYFDDVDLAREGDSFTYALAGGGASPLFDSITVSGAELRLDPAVNAVGTHTVQVRAIDAGGLQSPPVNIEIEVLLVIAIAQDDTATTVEGTAIDIDVMANDTLGDPVNQVISAGITIDLGDSGVYEDASESTPTIIINSLGIGRTEPNGSLEIVGGIVRYTPKENFSGTDFFHYTIQDGDGDVSTARVDITITDINQTPVSTVAPTFSLIQGQTLEVLAEGGLADTAFDADGDVITVMYETIPDPASFIAGGFNTNPDGSFSYTPIASFSGSVNFNIRFQDPSGATSPVVTVVIEVAPTPPPPAAPPANEVEFDMNLTDVPLEDAISTEANVLIVMDDSGSMDWDMMTDQSSGVFNLNNGGGVRSNGIRFRSTWFYYIFDLPTNIYNNPVAPTQDTLDAASGPGGDFEGNQHGVWRLRSAQYSTIYYNPEIQYLPWRGLDRNNNDFADAPPRFAPLDPFDSTIQTIDLTQSGQPLNTFTSRNVPLTRNNGNGRRNLTNSNVYYPYYYTTTATGRPEWDDPHTKVWIAPGFTYPGSNSRLDCAVLDDNPLECSYDEELQNFANWFTYYRNREYTAKAALGRAVAETTNLRMGYAVLNDSNDRERIDSLNSSFRTGHKADLLEQIYKVRSGGGTPLRRALARAGRHFECVSGDSFGSNSTTSPGSPACPILPLPEGQCQNNFTLLFSDGTWNGSNSSVPSSDRRNHDANVSGSGAVDTIFDGGVFADGHSGTLADIAMRYYERDLHPGIPDGIPTTARDITLASPGSFLEEDELMHQHMKTYTVGFGVTGDVELTDLPNSGVNPDTGEPVINFTEPFAWGNPFNNSRAKTDDMLHAALNGRGQFLQANNPVLLAQAFQDAFEEFADGSVSVSAVAFGSTRLRAGTVEYRGFFNLKFNSGDLEAIQLLDEITGLPPVDPFVWSAAAELETIAPNARRIVTLDRITNNGIPFRHGDLNADQQAMLSSLEVDYLRGVRTFEEPNGPFRAREGVLGDIVNSAPKSVGRPQAFRRDREPFPQDLPYSAFAEANKNRRRVVYVGANDGMLHAFNAGFQDKTPIQNGNGAELFAFVPNKLIDSTQRFNSDLDLLTSLVYSHKYFVDLTPTIEDVFMKANGSGSEQWRTLLVGGLRGGGKGYFALDVTDPDQIAASENNAANSVLWEFTDEDDTYPVDLMGVPEGGTVGARTDAAGLPVRDLGYSYSEPRIVMTNAGSTGRKKWAAVFGNGYNSTAGIAKLFVLFVDEGADAGGWENGDFVKINTGAGTITTDPLDPASNDPMAGIPNGLGQPTTIDSDGDGVTDLAYAGDLHGNLYRFDLSSEFPSQWKAVKLFTATLDGNTQTRQSITTAPVVSRIPGKEGLLVSFGTGSFITEQDGLSTDIQSVYGIWDRFETSPATSAPSSKLTRLVEQEITNIADETFPNDTLRIMSRNEVEYVALGGVSPNYGWYIDLNPVRASTTVQGNVNPDNGGLAPPNPQYPGERAIRRIIRRNGVLFLTTVIPRDANSCFRAPPGAIWFVDALTGGDPGRPIIDLNNDGVVDSSDMVVIGDEEYSGGILFDAGSGDGSLVDPSILSGDDHDYLILNKSHDGGSGGGPPIPIEPEPSEKTGRLSWWELIGE